MSPTYLPLNPEALKIGTVDFIGEEELWKRFEKKIQKGEPVTVKFGADPTRSDLHLGHTVILNKLRQFQEYGFRVQFIIGDFTAMIGDPSGRNRTRPPLEREEIERYAQTYSDQVFKILIPDRTDVYWNSYWLDQLGSRGIIKLSAQYTLARLLEREDFQSRHQQGIPISIHELLYPLCQGYDSVYLRSDAEIGGTDQKFNLIVGRELQKSFGLQYQQAVITCPILEGLDGQLKMSKSYNNAISIVEPPNDMFGKTMRISDELMYRWYHLLFLVPQNEIQIMKRRAENGESNPRDYKVQLAWKIVERFHGRVAADQAKSHFESIFSKKEWPEDLEPVIISKESPKLLIHLLHRYQLVTSLSEARRLIRQGAVELNGEKIRDENFKVDLDRSKSWRIRVGKKQFLHLIVRD